MAGAIAVTAGTLGALAPSAFGADAPGPGYVDRLDSSLQPLTDATRAEINDARDSKVEIHGGLVLVDVYVSGDPDAAANALEAAGMKVIATATDPLPVVEGRLPLDSLSDAAKLGRTNAVTAVFGGGRDVGAKTSEGVAAHNVPAAITSAGTDGDGVDVGIISDSIDRVNGGVSDSQATGDLPANTVVLKDDTSPGTIDEGRAMAEIVYDEAPGLNSIKFASGTAAGATDKAASIDQLTAAGVDVIADDIFYIDEPFFQDGVISQAVDRAKAAGVAYFASAGNRARQSYESVYRDSAGKHDFDPGAGTDIRSCFSGTVPTNGRLTVSLQWDEAWGSAATDLDLFLTNSVGSVLASATTDNIATGLPRELVTFQNLVAPQQVCVEIHRTAGTGTPFMKWIENDSFGPTPVPEFATNSNTINPDAASAQGSMAVAAVNAADPGLNTPETFSSRGPNTRLFDVNGNRLASPEVRANPDLAAADGVATTVPEFNPPNNSAFFGTSAATPSAAGIATILRSENPDATVNEVYAQMSDPANAIPCATATPIEDCGAGFILADRAADALDRTGAKVRAHVAPAKPNGKGRWYTRNVKVTWLTTDPESPIESRTGCDKVTVKTDGKKKLTCNALSGGGPGSGKVTIKHDSTKPSKPKIKGIKKNHTYSPKQVPKKVKCKSKDKTSGLKSCKISGLSKRPGKHKVRAIATDKAGLKSKSSLKYVVK